MKQLTPVQQILSARLAGLTLIDPRTVRRYLRGERVQPLIAARLASALDGKRHLAEVLAQQVAAHLVGQSGASASQDKAVAS